MGHVTLITPIREKSVIKSQVIDMFCIHSKFGDCRFSRFALRRMIAGVEIAKNGSRNTDHAHLGVICHH